MDKQLVELRQFFYTQSFTDGLRITIAVLFPALLFNQLNALNTGLSISLGAFCVSLTDAPGPIVQRRNGMLICVGFLFLVAALTSFVNANVWLLGLEIFVLSLFFSMFSVYGNRATSVGNSCILVLILTMDDVVGTSQILSHAAYIFTGGCWYLLISFAFYRLRPYRPSQRMLGDCFREIAKYLVIKSRFYQKHHDSGKLYRDLLAQQVVIHEKQDGLREILFKTRKIVEESTEQGRRLVWLFVNSVDLFEEISASYFHYKELENRFLGSLILDEFSSFIRDMASEVDRAGIAMERGEGFSADSSFESRLVKLKQHIDELNAATEKKFVLKKILVNLRSLIVRINSLERYFEKSVSFKKSSANHESFVGHQSLNPGILFSNFNFSSSVFKHALRVSIACLIGYAIVRSISYGNHSYWILLTIAFILKPAFSLTRQRNIERILGTLIGGAIGVLILYFIPNKNIQFVFLVIFMIGNYSFMRINYLRMVICATPFVLILFNFLGLAFAAVAQERVLDTVIGCAVAFTASYVLFPSWESEQLNNFMKAMIRANLAFIEEITKDLSGEKVSNHEHKLVRKEIYVSSANLSAAFQRMLSEPKSKQTDVSSMHQFVVLNHILYSNLATISSGIRSSHSKKYPDEIIHKANQTNEMLSDSLGHIGHTEGVSAHQRPLSKKRENSQTEEGLLQHLDFTYHLAADIDKIVIEISRVSGEPTSQLLVRPDI